MEAHQDNQNLKQITWEPKSEDDIFNTALGLKNYLLEEGIIKRTNTDDGNELSEKNINKRVDKYIEEHGQEILEFLGKNGKILVVMNSAEKFADRVIEKLGIDESMVVKIPVQTYQNFESVGKEIDEKTKKNLNEKLGDSKNIFILEDMIDSGNLLDLLIKFLNELKKETRTLCLFDKGNSKGKKIKKSINKEHKKLFKRKGNRKGVKAKKGEIRIGEDILQTIINLPNEFIIGYGIDYYLRLLAGLDGLYTIENQERFLEIMQIYIDKIKILAETEQVRKKADSFVT